MGNSWTFGIVTRQLPFSARETITRVLHQAQVRGFTTNFGTEYPVYVFDQNGDEHTFTEPEAMSAFLEQQIGLVCPFWYRGSDIWIEFLFGSLEPVRLGTSYDLKEEDQAFVDAVKLLFTDLCNLLVPQYGYAVSEWTQEDVYDAWKIYEPDIPLYLDRITRGEPIPFLFWMNYLTSQYIQQIGRRRLALPEAKIVDLKQGSLVCLGEYPWQAGSARLTARGTYEY